MGKHLLIQVFPKIGPLNDNLKGWLFLNSHAYGFLHKPVDLKEVMTVYEKALFQPLPMSGLKVIFNPPSWTFLRVLRELVFLNPPTFSSSS